MVEQDLNDSFPEDAVVPWTCPECGQERRVMVRFLEMVHCPDCLEALFEKLNADVSDDLDPPAQEVA
jgi:RNase P subunit RPR2